MKLRWLIVAIVLAGCASVDNPDRYARADTSYWRKAHDYMMCGGAPTSHLTDRCMASRGYRVTE